MVKYRIFVILGFLWLVLISSTPREKRLFKEMPPGTVMLNDSFYVDKTPVRVIDYLEFLSAIKHSYSPKMHDTIAQLPKWGLNKGILEELQEAFAWDSIYYETMLTRSWVVSGSDEKFYDIDVHIKNPRFFDYPLINVNYMQVTEYCKWRTDMVKLHYATISNTEKQRRQYPMNLEYRLPNKKEWDEVLSLYFGSVGKLKEDDDKYDKMMYNVALPYDNLNVFQYSSRNIAEMLDDFIVTTGFAWNEKFDLGSVSYIQFQEPTDWIGFRCVCEVLPEVVKKAKVIVLRDKFGKIIKPKKQSYKKQETPKPVVNTTKKQKSAKSKKKKMHLQTMKKKRKKRGR